MNFEIYIWLSLFFLKTPKSGNDSLLGVKEFFLSLSDITFYFISLMYSSFTYHKTYINGAEKKS